MLGLDVRPGGGFSYSVVDAQGTEVALGSCRPEELIDVVKKYKPSIIAVDNVRELLELGRRFVKRLGRLPSVPKIIQVTRLQEGVEVRMEDVVRRYLGIEVTALSPEQTAKYAAILALRGVGSAVKLFEEETKIVVKALISTKQGGQSRRRFERNIAIRIRSIVKNITDLLSKAGIDYDLFYHKDSEGVRSALIIAYSDRSTIRRFIKPIKSIDIKVSIEPVMSHGIKFITSESTIELSPKSKNRLIVGVDPGIVTGVAVMDLNGNVLLLSSGRNMSRRDVLGIVYEYGTPIVVATDVSKPPDYVKKLASMVGAVLYYPNKDLSISEKSNIALKYAEKYGVKVKTPHERDALAAAYKAFMGLQEKFDKVDNILRELPIHVDPGEVKELVVKGLPIKDALAKALEKYARAECKTEVVVRANQECKCQDEVKELKGYIRMLEDKLAMLESENARLTDELNRLYVTKCSSSNQTLESRIRLLEDRLEAETKKSSELADRLNEVKRIVSLAINGNGYVFAIRAKDSDEANIILNRGFLPMMTLQEVIRIINSGGSWLGMFVVMDEVGGSALRQLYKNGVTVLPLAKVKALDLSDDVKVIDLNRVNEYIEELKRSLSEVNYDLLEDMINEYRNSRRHVF